jgi:invasion protein IalB
MQSMRMATLETNEPSPSLAICGKAAMAGNSPFPRQLPESLELGWTLLCDANANADSDDCSLKEFV